MFILLTIKDVIRIEPGDFGKEHVAVGPRCCVCVIPRRP